MDRKELKKKIRRLKKLELKFRYGYSFDYIEKMNQSPSMKALPLIWKEFFDLNEPGSKKAKYSMNMLEQMDKDQLKLVFDEFWFLMYYRMYQERGILMEIQDPELLTFLGLPFDADQAQVRKRFRELCKRYHPDEGGDQEKFIELMDMMEKYDIRRI